MTDMKTIGVLGAGQMGAGIAHVAAVAGYDVMLADVDVERASKGKAGIAKRLARAGDTAAAADGCAHIRDPLVDL